MPDPNDPAQATAPPPDGGAVPSGDAGGPGGVAQQQQPGMLPPSTSPQSQNVNPAGLEATGQDFARKAMAMLHLARMATNPYTEHGKDIDKAWKILSKHFAPDSDNMQSTGMAKPGAPPGQGAPGQPPPMGSMPPQAAPPQGPIPMKAAA